ncbi:efflux RND transporter periplasmic adaptor subunit [Desulfobacula phenolica]|uniref:HlyD family secretion protein n=1 Tax=Desulfobacula phenolica TaxID=90732 RepID=A0A1H2IQH5_9BACT|nr:efflux RND transporter periplasmic adaptor subunit [Desulfobacula phenolica]SDU46078.1 HlyD family secretion protein [Desulfobacula phenolica]
MKIVKIGIKFLKLALMTCGVLFIILTIHRSLAAFLYQDTPKASQFRIEKIKRGSIENTISCTGTLSAVGTVEVGTQVSGTIKKVLVDYNDRVTKGQILAELDLDTFNAAVDTANASVIKSRALYKQATADYERNKPLYEQGHLSSQEILIYETEKETARAELLSAKAFVKKEKINLRNAQIRSPINGVILKRDIEEGQTVAASLSTPTLFIIAENLSSMEIEASVDESDIGMVNKGQEVTFTVQSYPDDLFYGTVTQIQMNPTETSNVVMYTVIVAAPNKKGKLLPGMTATADFVVEKAENELLVSNAALNFRLDDRKNKEDSGIYVLDGGISERICVTTGITDSMTTVIKSENLTPGTLVIIGNNIEKTKSSKGFMSKIFPKSPGGGRGPRI